MPPEATHPRLELNDAIHQPVRLSLMAALSRAERVDFAFLRDHLRLGDSNLSQHITALERAGYVLVNKVFEGKRGRTWLSLSETGRAAFQSHIDVLRRIVEGEK